MYARQTMKNPRSKRAKTYKRRKIRRSRKFAFDPACWGKNEPLEQLWRDLSSYLSAVIVYKGSKPYEIVRMQSQSPSDGDNYALLREYDADPQVIAILTAHPDVNNAYETLVYPKAKDKTVDHVITNYTRFFKRAPATMKTRFPMKKLMIPYY